MKINLDRLEQLRHQKYLKRQDHPTLPLSIWNYSEACQYHQYWTHLTLMCRGLIVDNETREIIANPWNKFFNYQEPSAPEPPDLPFEVYDKVDGSLCIVCLYKGLPIVASKGSFNSWHRQRSLEIILDKYSDLFNKIEEGKTYLFELVSPESIIVINYGIEELYQLTVIDNETREESMPNLGPPHVEKYEGYDAIDKLPSRKDREGYVVRFSDGTRLKLKESDYVELHAARFNTSEKSIWRMLKEGKSKEGIEESLLASLPDERHQWAKDTLEALTNDFEAIRGKVISEYSRIQEELGDSDRKAYAEEIKKRDDIKHLLFMHMSGKDFTEAIWKDIEPKLG